MHARETAVTAKNVSSIVRSRFSANALSMCSSSGVISNTDLPGSISWIFCRNVPAMVKGCAECVDACGDHDALKMIRKTSDTDYGLFVLVQSAITLLMSGQMAWLSSPLAVVAPGKAPALRRLMVGAVEISQRRFLRRASAVALVVPVIGYFLHVCTGLESLVIALGIAACWTALQREYLRGVLLIYGRPQSMLRADLINVGVLFGVFFLCLASARYCCAVAALCPRAGGAKCRRSSASG